MWKKVEHKIQTTELQRLPDFKKYRAIINIFIILANQLKIMRQIYSGDVNMFIIITEFKGISIFLFVVSHAVYKIFVCVHSSY